MVNYLKIFLVLLTFHSFGFDSTKVNVASQRTPFNHKPQTFAESDKTRYWKLDASDKGILKINSSREFSIFIDHQLAGNNITSISWDLDSLRSIYVFPITIAVFSEHTVRSASSEISLSVGDGKKNGEQNSRSAITITSFFLVWLLIFLFNTNRAVTLEYLSFSKFFSIRAMDESVLSQRITSLNNVFVYFFCSALISINLFLLDLRPQFFLVPFSAINILILSVGILMMLGIKIMVLKVCATIFNQAEIAPTQLFNFVKLALGCFMVSSLFLITFFILNIETSVSRNAIGLTALIMATLYLVITFLRLNNRVGFTVFHLFSYLCLSEIFPMLLLLKICYF